MPNDFFISYNKANRAWAEWIAWVVESEGYSSIIQEWDFKAGGNFVVEMDKAMKQSERTIAVLSQDYVDAAYTTPEWAHKFAQDPQGLGRKLVPVRVAPCDVEGLLGQVIYIDLVGLDEEMARKRLLSQLSPGRTKPATAPTFPGGTAATGKDHAAFPVAAHPVPSPRLWTPIGGPVEVRWRADVIRSEYPRATLELHSIMVDSSPLETRALRDLANLLAILGRQRGLFDQNEAIDTSAFEDRAEAHSAIGNRVTADKGITVYRDRQIVTWLPLPHGNLGSVFDEEDVRNRLIALLSIHAGSSLLGGTKIALAVSVEPITMMMVGSAGDVERRTSGQFLYTMAPNSSLRIQPTNTVEASALTTHADQIAEELTAQLALRLQSLR